MSRFREIYSTERFAQVVAISQEFLERPLDVEHVNMFTVSNSERTFAQNRYGPFGAQTIEHRDVTPEQPS